MSEQYIAPPPSTETSRKYVGASARALPQGPSGAHTLPPLLPGATTGLAAAAGGQQVARPSTRRRNSVNLNIWAAGRQNSTRARELGSGENLSVLHSGIE
eukprot:COSAG05_NODE_7402_length_816_cov_1.428173_1_plen_99_part_10